MPELTPRQREIRDRFIDKRGYWAPHIEALLRVNDELFEAHLKNSEWLWKSSRLDSKTKEFIYIAIDVTVTHLYEPGLRLHTKNALAQGATHEEIAEVISFASTTGLATFSVGLPLILEEAMAAGVPVPAIATEGQQALVDRFRARVGYLPEGLAALAGLDPDYFKLLTDVTGAASRCTVLSPKTRAFIRLAVQVTATSLDRDAARLHIREAFEHGATVGELVELLEMVSVVGLHACTFGGAIVFEGADG